MVSEQADLGLAAGGNTTAGASSHVRDEATSSNPTMDYQDEEEIPIPPSLKFILDALKAVSQTPLTAENHLVWTSQIETIFRANGYQQHLDPSMRPPTPSILNPDGSTSSNPRFLKWNLCNSNLVAAVVSTISPSIQPFAMRKETVADLYSSLKLRLQSTTKTRKMQLKEELHGLQMKGESMNAYLTSVKAIVDQLEASGTQIDNDDLMLHIMNGLTSIYDGFKTVMRLRETDTPLNSFYSLLQSEEQNLTRRNQMQGPSNNTALASERGRPPNNRPDSRGKGKQTGGKPPSKGRPPAGPPAGGNTSTPPGYANPPPTYQQNPNLCCQICKKPGHSADRCWYRFVQPGSSAPPPKSAYYTDNQEHPPYSGTDTDNSM